MLFVNSQGQILAGLRPKRSYLPHIQSVMWSKRSTLDLNRKEILAFILLALVSLITIIAAINWLQEAELVLEGRRGTYCFDGYLKSVFCISLIVFVPSLICLITLGYKIRQSKPQKLILGKAKVLVISLCFFLSIISFVTCLLIASNSCV